jgi:hypothetical protein
MQTKQIYSDNKLQHMAYMIISYLKEKAVTEEGLLRLSGNQNNINKLKEKFETGSADLTKEDFHDIAG